MWWWIERAALREAGVARQQHAPAVRRRARLAQGRPALGAGQAMAAGRHEHHHDVIARHEIVDARPRLDDDDAGRLVGRAPSASAAAGCRLSPTGRNGRGPRRRSSPAPRRGRAAPAPAPRSATAGSTQRAALPPSRAARRPGSSSLSISVFGGLSPRLDLPDVPPLMQAVEGAELSMAEGSERAPRSLRGDYRTFRRITTRWMDNDVYGHVNNVVYYAFFDTAVNATLIEAGVLDPVTSAVIGLVVETGCRYAAPLSFPGRCRRRHPGGEARHVERALRGRPVRRARGSRGPPRASSCTSTSTARRAAPAGLPADLRGFLERLLPAR